jgi:hypothetical protein
MSELQVIEGALKRANSRRRLERVWRGFWRGLLAGAGVWLAVFAVYKLFPISPVALQVAAYAAGATILFFMVWSATRRLSLLDTARWLDRKRGLKERVSTAWELGRSEIDENWKQLVATDAAKHVKEVDPRSLVPLRLPTAGKWALLIVLLGAGLGFVPEYRSKNHLQKQAEVAHVRETGKQLADLARRNLVERPPALEPTQQSLESLTELGEKLSKASLTRGEALRELTSAMERLDKEAKQLSDNPALKRMEQAVRESGGSGQQAPGDLQKQIQSLQEKLGQSANPNTLDKANEALQKAQQALANLGNQTSAEAQAAREQLAQSLGELAQQMRDSGHPMPDLEEAIRALQNNQTDNVVRNLQTALQDLEKLREMAKTLQKLQQQAGGVGKDLPEQLQYGQTQSAQKRMEQMAEQLKSGDLSQEQLQKLADEVSRAVDPGSQYGKVGDMLKQAAQQAQSGDKAAAAESLAQAAKELQKLQQELGDAQALMAAMDALDRAEMALMTGKKWEECQGAGCKACNGEGCKQCRKGTWGHGGKGSPHGVGTWADETGWMQVPDEQHATDNSGINRPDMDSRGIADRPPNINPNLLPTKVRGQMSQGGPMPSITLKGVSIKGQSTVEYQEAAAAAQNDAQSALNQDKVPRAYQNAVRDYFDDIKQK